MSPTLRRLLSLSLFLVTAATTLASALAYHHRVATFRSAGDAHLAQKACASTIPVSHWHLQRHALHVRAVVFADPAAHTTCAQRLQHEIFEMIERAFVDAPIEAKADHHILTALSPAEVPEALRPRAFGRTAASGISRRLTRVLVVLSCASHEAMIDVDDTLGFPVENVLATHNRHFVSAGVNVSLPRTLCGSAHGPFGPAACSSRPNHRHVACRHGAAHVVLPLQIDSVGDDDADRVHPRIWASIVSLPRVRWMEAPPRFTAANRVATQTLQSESQFVVRPLWEHGLTGSGQIVAVGDTGVDWDSCFFDDVDHEVAQWPRVNDQHRKIISYVPCVDGDTGALDVMDAEGGHGTHVCGSVAGNAVHNSKSREKDATVVDRSKYNGMAKDAKLFFYDLTCGSSVQHQDMIPPGDLYDFFEPGYFSGARVSSNSWGDNGSPKSYTAVLRRTDQFAFDHPDHVIVFAAGNSPVAGVISPAAGKSVLTVGAHPNAEQESSRDMVCSFSARGATFDARIKPDLLAPGQSIVSARSDGDHTTHQCLTMSLFGTSMACPLVAGSAALVRQYFTDGFVSGKGTADPNATMLPLSSTIRAMLIHSAVLIHPTEVGPNSLEGWGRVRPGTVLFLNNTGRRNHVYVDEYRQGLVHREAATWCVSIEQFTTDTPFAVTVVWTDPALAAEGSSRSVVNDLDLTVINALNGLATYGNHGPSFDRDNVVEKVVLHYAAAGYYTVNVYGHHVEPEAGHETPAYQGVTRRYNGSQPFSIVATGRGIIATRGTCGERYREQPPPPPNPQSPRCPSTNNVVCSGNGQCNEDGVCVCIPGYHHFDCSQCDGELVCHGNGACAKLPNGNLQCTCGANFDATLKPDCSACVAGKYGPHCDGDCVCHHGTCNKTSGRCLCDSNRQSGFWDGSKCDRCQFDYLHSAVDSEGKPLTPAPPPCTVAATWCVNRELRHVPVRPGHYAYLTINDNPNYDNSMSCGWIINSTSPFHGVHLAFTMFDVEKPFDAVEVYKGTKAHADALIGQGTGTAAPQPVRVGAGESILVLFRSDYLGNNFKGITAVMWTEQCVDAQCHGHGACTTTTGSCLCSDGFDPAFDCEIPLAATTTTTTTTTTIAPTTATPTPATATSAGASDSPRHTSIVTAPPTPRPTTSPSASCAAADPQGTGVDVTCSGAGACTADGICQCVAPARGVACQVNPTTSLTMLTADTPLQRVTAAPNASRAWRFVRYLTSTPLPLPFPDQQILRLQLYIDWTSAPQQRWRVVVWNSEDRAGIVDGREVFVTEVTVKEPLVLDVYGFNEDAAKSTTVGLQRLDAIAADDVDGPTVSAKETVDVFNATLCGDGGRDGVCHVTASLRTAAAPDMNEVAQQPAPTPGSQTVNTTGSRRRYHVFHDPGVLYYVGSGLIVAFLCGYILAAVRHRRARYVELQAADDGVAGPADFEMGEGGQQQSHHQPRVVTAHAVRVDQDATDSDDDEDLELHPAVIAAEQRRGR